MPQKIAVRTLEEIWNLEDKYTAFAGSPSGAKSIADTDLQVRPDAMREKGKESELSVAEDSPEQ